MTPANNRVLALLLGTLALPAGAPPPAASRTTAQRGAGSRSARATRLRSRAGTEFTAADVMRTFPVTTMRLFLKYDLAPYAHILAYVKRVEARAAYQRAMALAGPNAGRKA